MSDITIYVRLDKLLQAALSLLILYTKYYMITKVPVSILKLIRTYRENSPRINIEVHFVTRR